MKLNRSGGEMYSDHYTTNPLAYGCHLSGHKCSYCSTHSFTNRYDNLKEKYSDEVRLVESVLTGKTGSGKTIFVCNMTDMFAKDVPEEYILKVLEECRKYPDNTYLFQTKNPKRFLEFLSHYPEHSMFGTTIETNRESIIKELTEAPSITSRVHAMCELRQVLWDSEKDWKSFVTIEPILDFDVSEFEDIIENISPDFVNIGADSKVYKFPKIYNNLKLPEPDGKKLKQFIRRLKNLTEIREKSNLDRLLVGQI